MAYHSAEINLSTDKTHESPHFRHHRCGDCRRALRTIRKQPVDFGRISQKIAHLFGDWRELCHGEIGERILEDRKLRSSEFVNHRCRRMIGEGGINVDQILRLGPA